MDRRLSDAAKAAGLDMLNQRIEPQNHPAPCGFDPGRSLFANWRGQVALCRYSALPVANGQYYRYQTEKASVLQTRVLGNLSRKALGQIAACKSLSRSQKECRSVCGNYTLKESRVRRERKREAAADSNGKVIHLSHFA
jgi:hypothetical protein